MSAPTGVPMEVHMESSDHMDYLEEKVAQMVVQNEFLTNTILGIADKLDLLTQPWNISSPTLEKRNILFSNNNNNRKHIKPLLPSDFNGEHSKGQAFLNSCELYVKLTGYQFSLEADLITWALTYMKSGRALLFIDWTLRYESRCRKPMFTTWREVRQKFMEEFCPKNEAQMALAKLKMSAYYQSQKSMDEYIDEFRDLRSSQIFGRTSNCYKILVQTSMGYPGPNSSASNRSPGR